MTTMGAKPKMPPQTPAPPQYRSRLGILVRHELRDAIGSSVLWLVSFSLALIYAIYEQMSVADHPTFMIAGFLVFGASHLSNQSMTNQESRSIREALLSTSIRRWELVAGKFLAVAAAYFICEAVLMTELLILARIPSGASHSKYLPDFHPTPPGMIGWLIVMATTGLPMMAVTFLTSDYFTIKSTRRSLLTRLINNVVLVLVLCSTFFFVDYIMGSFPSRNGMWPNSRFIPVEIAVSIMVTVIFLVLTTRNVKQGAYLGDE